MKFNRRKHNEISDENELISLYRKTGDLILLGKAYEKYTSLVYGVCLKYLKDEEQAKDAVMQIFEQLIAKLRMHEVTNFKSWLYTLTRNYCLMELRSSQKHEFVNLEDYGVEKEVFLHPEEGQTDEQELQKMEKCIEQLPEEQRVSIDLFYMQQKCYKEIVEITGYDIKKVKSYIQNGKRNLKICMEKNSESK